MKVADDKFEYSAENTLDRFKQQLDGVELPNDSGAKLKEMIGKGFNPQTQRS